MDTEDYITQCAHHLSSKTYRLAIEYPTAQIARSTETTLDEFKSSLFQYNKRLYHFLKPKVGDGQIPKFYSIP